MVVLPLPFDLLLSRTLEGEGFFCRRREQGLREKEKPLKVEVEIERSFER